MLEQEFQTHVIDNILDFQDLKSYINSENFEELVLDVETDSKIERKAKLYGIGLCFQDNEAFYLVWRNKDETSVWTKTEEKEITDWLYEISSKHKLIGHNLVYDILVLKYNLGINLIDLIYSDTILQRHTLSEEGPFALKKIAVEYLGEWANKAQEELYKNIEQNGGKTTKDQMDMFKADTNILAEYCCWDVILTYKLFIIFEKKLIEEKLYDLFYKEEIMPLYKNCTILMKDKGFPINVEYYKNLKVELEQEINKLEFDIIESIKDIVSSFEDSLLNESFPIKQTGNFPKFLCKVLNIPLPVNEKTGEITLSRKNLEKQRELFQEHTSVYRWLLQEDNDITSLIENTLKLNFKSTIRKIQENMFFEKNPNKKYIFNLKSNDHLIHLVYEKLEVKVRERTEKGKPKIDDDVLEQIKEEHEYIKKIVDFKKLNKLLSTYVDGILSRELDGHIYTSLLQFGTISGRYSSRDPNLQNIPRLKDEDSGLSELVQKYTNAIKKGFVAPEGYKIVNADYSSLEPVCFAHVSNEEKLRKVFINDYDLYSTIAIDVFKVKNCSANKKDSNYLKNIHPEFRQQAKVFCLAVVYGAEASRIKDLLGLDYKQCEKLINEYLNTYPELKKYMKQCNNEAKHKGFVSTQFGRIRHLPRAKIIYSNYGDSILDYKWANNRGLAAVRREYKNCLNNSKNFKIQGLAAHIVNRSMIAIQKAFKDNNIDGYLIMQVHDENTCIVREDQVELASKLIKNCMENTTKISVPLKTEPLIANNWSDAK